jgi:hypothetical protein
LRVLAKYGELLGKLANSDAPDRVSASAQILGDSLGKLDATVRSLKGVAASGESNATFMNAFSPVSAIIGEVARLIVERKMQKALDRAIIDEQRSINILLNALRDDLTIAYERKRNAFSEARVIVVAGYANELAKPKPDTDVLRKRANEIKANLSVWEAFPLTNPGEGIDALQEAHAALVAYAKSSKKPQDISEFAAQMEAFAGRAQRIGEAIRELRAN